MPPIRISSSQAPNEELLNIWKNKELLDVTIVLDCGAELRAHRLVLAMNSTLFRRMLGSSFVEGKSSSIKLGEVCRKELQAMLEFFYEGATEAQELRDGISLARIADMYEAVGLREAVVVALENRISNENAVEMLRSSRAAGLHRLSEGCIRLLREGFRELSQSPQLALLDAETMGQILEGDSLNARDETEVYHAVMRWLRERGEDDQAAIDVLKLVRFPQLSLGFLRNELGILGEQDGRSIQGQVDALVQCDIVRMRCILEAISAISGEKAADQKLFAHRGAEGELNLEGKLPLAAWKQRRFGGESAWAYDPCLQPWIVEGHEGSISALKGWRGYLISSSHQYSPAERTLQVWNLKTWKTEQDVHCEDGDCLCLCVIGEVLFCGTSEGGIVAWCLLSWERLERCNEHVGEVMALTALGSRYLVSGSSDATLLLWDVKGLRKSTDAPGAGCKMVEQLEGHVEGINSLVACNERGFIISASADLSIRVWRKESSWTCQKVLNMGSEAMMLELVDQIAGFAAALRSGEIHFFNLDSLCLMCAISAHSGSPVRAITLNGNSQLLSVADERMIKAWDLEKLGKDDCLAWTVEVSEGAGIQDAEARALIVWQRHLICGFRTGIFAVWGEAS